jgi:tetratricopeptide (TPR) repeat protein
LLGRGVRYVVIPSWDPFFEDFARLYLVEKFSGRSSLLVTALRRWNLPPWLRPVPYQMPVGGGSGGQSVLVFEVVDEQSPAAAAGRLAEYFVEMGDLDDAAAAAESLRRFPGDVGALAARAQVQSARGDSASSAKTVDALLARISNGGDRYLPWDRRVSLATVLARAGRIDLALDETRRCMRELSEARLRSLSVGSLYDLLVLARAFRLEISDPRLRELAVDLLPENLRSRL